MILIYKTFLITKLAEVEPVLLPTASVSIMLQVVIVN